MELTFARNVRATGDGWHQRHPGADFVSESAQVHLHIPPSDPAGGSYAEDMHTRSIARLAVLPPSSPSLLGAAVRPVVAIVRREGRCSCVS